MKLIPEVKCRRCGTSFSSLRSSCPNCGTRKVNQSRRSPATTSSTVEGTEAYDRNMINTKWQMIFGLILVVAVILAVVVMVSTSLNGADAKVVTTPTAGTETETESLVPVVETPPTPTPTPTPAVEKVAIRYCEVEKTEFTMHIGDVLTVDALVTPATISDKVTWSCTDESGQYMSVTVDPENGNKCTLECLASVSGGVKLTATLNGVSAVCQIYLVA